MNRVSLFVFLLTAGLFFGFAGSTCWAVTYGNTTPFGTQSNHFPDYVLGVNVNVSQPLELISFGLMYGHPDFSQSSSNAIFGLYDSTGTGGNPGTLMASTGIENVSALTTYTFNFTSNPTIAAGTYWMMALYESQASPRMDTTNGASLVAYYSQSFASGMETTAPSSTNYNGQNFNYWINGNPIPEPASICLLGIASAFGLMRLRGKSRSGRCPVSRALPVLPRGDV